MTEKLYWSIGEVSKELKEKPSTIRWWLSNFGDVKRSAINKERMFTVSDIERLRKIKHLIRVEKYTLEGAKMKIKSLYKIPKESNDFIDLVDQ